jgi:hypothetical protein
MPYRIRKRNCTRSDGKKGKYLLQYKPKKKTKKKKDSEGYVTAGCHTSKDKASAQRAAIEGGPINSGDERHEEALIEMIIVRLLEVSNGNAGR